MAQLLAIMLATIQELPTDTSTSPRFLRTQTVGLFGSAETLFLRCGLTWWARPRMALQRASVLPTSKSGATNGPTRPTGGIAAPGHGLSFLATMTPTRRANCCAWWAWPCMAQLIAWVRAIPRAPTHLSATVR